MRDDRPFPSPFGFPTGPLLPTPELLSAYLEGARTGSSPEAHIEEPVLLASDHLVAVRLDVAVLVRSEAPTVAQPVKAALCRALEASGLLLVEQESVLAGAVAVELAVPRGFEWDLWARDAEQAREALVRRAQCDAAGLRPVDRDRDALDARMHDVLDQLERDW